MCCKDIGRMMNDYLNKTLTSAQEQKVEKHIASCESCRRELLKLREADDALRTVVCEMVSEIKVPGGLNWRIEKALAARRKQDTPVARLAAFLKNPAVAAALLFLMIAGGVFSHNNFFRMTTDQPRVAMPALQDGGTVDGAVGAVLDRDKSDAAGVPEVNERNEAPGTQEITVSGSSRKEPQGEQLNMPADNAPELAQAPGLQAVASRNRKDTQEIQPAEQGLLMTGQLTQADGGRAPQEESVFSIARGYSDCNDTGVLRTGTIDEAATGAGFQPARPAYLPPGAELGEVTWTPGVVYQNYRVGRYSFTVSQGRANEGSPLDGGMARQGTPVEINRNRAVLQETSPETGSGTAPAHITVNWRCGEWDYSVGGALPKEEIIRIALSLR